MKTMSLLVLCKFVMPIQPVTLLFFSDNLTLSNGEKK